ncbi:hypothetical protein [Vibrio sp. 10N.261.51.F12]|uniref:hypothetical protein n=1 Tax=Vibrio sp. 10N.261.51.F12 TaxID=3229679 RepID=UPI0035502408
MNLRNNTITAATLFILSSSVLANQPETEEINYGDPLASFKSAGVSVSNEKSIQFNGMYGVNGHIGILDLTRTEGDKASGEGVGLGYRARYLNVDDGLGLSIDIIGNHNNLSDSTIGVVSAVYEFQVGNFMFFPMVGVGQMEIKGKKAGADKYSTSIVQPGLHAMYAFDEGHWLYANPKITHALKAPTGADNSFDHNTLELEIGGGYMLNDWSSAEFKVENSFKNSNPNSKNETTGWVKYAVYF